MPKFIEHPLLTIGARYKFVLASRLVYFSDLVGHVVVCEGFETDLASIPRFFHRILPINDNHRLAAIVHDYLYSTSGRYRPLGHFTDKQLTRKQCDDVFMEAMILLKVKRWRRIAMYYAVRWFGGSHFKRYPPKGTNL